MCNFKNLYKFTTGFRRLESPYKAVFMLYVLYVWDQCLNEMSIFCPSFCGWWDVNLLCCALVLHFIHSYVPGTVAKKKKKKKQPYVMMLSSPCFTAGRMFLKSYKKSGRSTKSKRQRQYPNNRRWSNNPGNRKHRKHAGSKPRQKYIKSSSLEKHAWRRQTIAS